MEPLTTFIALMGWEIYVQSIWCPEKIDIYYTDDLTFILSDKELNEEILRTFLLYRELKKEARTLTFPGEVTISSLVELRSSLLEKEEAQELVDAIDRLINVLEDLRSGLKEFAEKPACGKIQWDYGKELNEVYEKMLELLDENIPLPYGREDVELLLYNGQKDLKTLKKIFEVNREELINLYEAYLRSKELYMEWETAYNLIYNTPVKVGSKRFDSVEEAMDFLYRSGLASERIHSLYNELLKAYKGGEFSKVRKIFEKLKDEMEGVSLEREEEINYTTLSLLFLIAIVVIYIILRVRGKKDENGYVFTFDGDDLIR